MDEFGSPYRRALLLGIVAGLLLTAAGVAALVAWGPEEDDAEPPGSVLVVALAEDVDQAVVAGAVFRLDGSESTETIEFVDTGAKVDIPGTSYDRLKDAYSFGGGERVAQAVADLTGEASDAWVVLPADVWMALVDSAGGVSVDVPEATNAFIDGELYVVGAGRQRLSGGELLALHSGSFFTENEIVAEGLRDAFSTGVSEVVSAGWNRVVEAVEAGDVDASRSSAALQNFGHASDTEP